MSDLFKQHTGANGVAVIGKGMIIKGSIHSRQDVFLDGELEGVLDVENCRLTIGPNGKAVANTRAREVDIHGSVKGNVESTHKISIRTSGRLEGDIRTAGIVIESGAYFKGRVDIITSNGDAKNGDAKNGDAKNGDAKNGDAKNGDAKNGDVKNGDAKNGDAKTAGDA